MILHPKKDSLVGGKRCWIVSSITVFIFPEGGFWIFFWIMTLKTVQIFCGGRERKLNCNINYIII